MGVTILKKTLENKFFKFNAMAFIPDENIKNEWALCTHGYTSCKMDTIPWAQRLSNSGVPTVIFDLPGHYLGSFNEVEDGKIFTNHAQECFIDAYEFLQDSMGQSAKCESVLFTGHSLGALLSFKALNLDYFKDLKKIAVGVGFGISQHKSAHLFETSFYEKTLAIRKQLVSPAINPDLIFPWIKDEKVNLKLHGQTLHLITGVDDVVVGEGGAKAMSESLNDDNEVTFYEPRKLPHHEPALAATHIYHYFQKKFNW